MSLIAKKDSENCRIELLIPANVNSTILVLRASSETGLSTYETVATLSGPISQKYFYDYSVEPGLAYRYKIGTNTSDIIILDTTGSFLLGELNKQINFTYSGQISDFKEIKKESIVETIGGKYPFVIRNSNIGYKQFGFSAMVTSSSDNLKSILGSTYSSMFGLSTSDSELNTAYTNYVQGNNIRSDLNFIIEKQYKKLLNNWLNDGKVKLFKSDTEGLFLVRATDISFTPVNETGRVLYNTSFTFTEVDEVSIANLQKYDIISTPHLTDSSLIG